VRVPLLHLSRSAFLASGLAALVLVLISWLSGPVPPAASWASLEDAWERTLAALPLVLPIGVFLAMLRPGRRGELRALAALGVSPGRVLAFAMIGMLPVAGLLFGTTLASAQKLMISPPRPLLRAEAGRFAGDGFVFVREPEDAIHLVHDAPSEKHQDDAHPSNAHDTSVDGTPSDASAFPFAHRGKMLGATSWLLGLALAIALGMAILAYPRWPASRIRGTVVLAAIATLMTLLLAQSRWPAVWLLLGPALLLAFLWHGQRQRLVTTPQRAP
jgi:hypothetical protein